MSVTSSKYKAESALEEDLDRDFFTIQQQQAFQIDKLNKGEKRALKFAIKRGIKLDEIPNLKGWLEDQVKIAKARRGIKNIVSDAGAKAKKNDKYNRGKNNSNKFYAFTQFDEEGAGGNFSD